MSILNRVLSAVGIESSGLKPAALSGGGGRLSFGGQSYDAGGYSTPHTENWWEQLTTANQDVLTDRTRIVARARALVRNNPTVAGGIDRLCETVIGARMWLEATPDYEAMGRTAEWADTWATKAEANFRTWSLDRRCDVDGKLRFPEMLRAAYRHWLVDGEALAVLYDMKRGSRFSTAVKLIDPDRLSNPDGMADYSILANGNMLIGGCEIAPHGEVIAYHIRARHPNDPSPALDKFVWKRIARYTRTGRVQVVHAFRLDRADQRRGISRLAAAMVRIKMSERYDVAELDAALLNAIYAGFVESPAPTSEVRDMLAPVGDTADAGYIEKLAEYRRDNKVRLGNGTQFIHLAPGEKAGFQAPERPAANFPAFHAAHDRMASSSIGLTYPQYSGDWTSINYSSARTLLNEFWRGALEDRDLFTQEFATPIYAAVLEEMAARGDITIPGGRANFYRYKAELIQCEWQGPGRGTIDPLKEANAADLDMHAGRSNLAIEGANNGRDPRKVLQGLAREKRLRKQLGMEPFVPLKVAQGSNGPAQAADQQAAMEQGVSDAQEGQP